jgi:Ca-activated chloride channel family protein
MAGLRFDQPLLLFALLVIPAIIAWRHYRGRAPLRVVPHAAVWSGTHRTRQRPWIAALYAALALIIAALARPQHTAADQRIAQQGYDLMLVVDLSTSMLSEDYQGPKGRINRLETIRPIIQQFVRNRPDDRIGIAVFARQALTLAPLTTDHGWLARQVASLRTGMMEDGTAIGDGLGIALLDIAAARASAAPSAAADSVGAFIVLLTDGSNNSGELTPAEATALARYRKIPIYTIGTGRNGMVPFPVFDANGKRVGTSQQPSTLDIEALRTIAAQTGGRFFMAGDTRALQSAFAAIDAARKAQFQVKRTLRIDELFVWFAVPALLLLAVAAQGLRLRRPAA